MKQLIGFCTVGEIMPGVTNISMNSDMYKTAMLKEIKELEINVGRVLAGMAERAFVRLVFETPQYSGWMAASWMMTVNRQSHQTAEESKYPKPENPYQKGHSTAVVDAISRAEGKSKSFKSRYEAKGWSIHFRNNVPYASEVEDGTVQLRSNVGHSPHFFERFQQELAEAKAVTPAQWEFYGKTDFLGRFSG
jgi:hypothetical protein